MNGADRYELVVSTDANFTINVINLSGSSALTANAWQCDQDLNYDCAYFWKVRACNATNASPWSDVNAFLTGPRPLPPPTPTITTAPIIIDIPTQAPVVIPAPQINYIAPENPTPVYSPTTIVEFNLPKWAIISILGVNGIIVFLLVIVILVVWKDRRH